MEILKVDNLVKRFGDNLVLDGVSFSVPQNSVFGFLGRNGAGKTTTMKMVLGLITSDGGSISVCGEPVSFGQNKTNRHIGYLPDVPEFYGFMNAVEYLDFCGEITKMPRERIAERRVELLELVGLSGITKKIRSYSRGMKQRLGIAQALLNEPKLLICDEPTSALDPVGRKEILDILKSVKSKTTVIFSTHILADVERICDRIAVIEKGKVVLGGSFEELKLKHKTNGLSVEFKSQQDKEMFVGLREIAHPDHTVRSEELVVTVESNDIDKTQETVLRALVQNKLLPVKLELLEPSIESLFLEVLA